MLKKVLLTLIVGLMTTTVSAFEASHLNKLHLTNNTGTELWYVFISPGDSDLWGLDALVSEVTFENKTELSFDLLYPDYENYFDIMAIDEAGNAFFLFDLLVSDDGEAYATLDASMLDNDKSSHSFANVWIENNTDHEMKHVFVSSNDSEMWGVDFMSGGYTLGAYETVNFIVLREEGIATYDIMGIYGYDSEYTSDFDIDYDEFDENGYTFTINNIYGDDSDADDSYFDTDVLNNLTIINNTGTEIAHVFISPGDSGVWGLDALGSGNTLRRGETLSFDIFYPEYENFFDIMAVDRNGNTFTLLDELISDDEEARVTLDGSMRDEEQSDMSFAEVRIQNPTDKEILYLFISPSDSDMWGIDFMGSEQTLEPHSSLSWAVPVGNDMSIYDVFAADEDLEKHVGDFDIGYYEFEEGSVHAYTIGNEISEDEYVYDDSYFQNGHRGAKRGRGN